MNANEQAAALGESPAPAAWPGRHRIGSFELLAVVARSETGLVYRAWDHALERPVAVKEYLPAALARRAADGDVQAAGPDADRLFERGRYAFVDEARTLGRCDHPSLVRVLDLIEAHGTAYRAMPWYSGRLLLDVRRKMAGPLAEAALRSLLDNLLDALEDYQRVGAVHRGLNATQVLLLDDGRALLLGPGAVGRALQSGSAGSAGGPAQPGNPGFAPPEQASVSNGHHGQAQGPWTDFYALAAVARYCITGVLPPAGDPGVCEPLAETVERLGMDRRTPRFSDELLRTLDAALSPHIAKRPQSAAQFRDGLLQAQPGHPAAAVHLIKAGSPAESAGAKDATRVDPAGALDREPARGVQHAVDPAAEPIDSMLEPDSQASSLLQLAPTADQDDRQATHPPPSRHWRWVLWPSLALAAGAAIGLGAWELQTTPFRLSVAALLPARDTTPPPRVGQGAPSAEMAPDTAAPARDAPSSRPADAPGRATPVEPAPPKATGRGEPKPPSAPARPARPTPAATSVAPTAPPAKRPAADPATPLSSPSPRQECGARTEFSLYRCMRQQCSLAKWRQHPQCVRLEATDSVE